MWKHKDALVNDILANLDRDVNGNPIAGYVYVQNYQKAFLITEVLHQGTKASDLWFFGDFYLDPLYKDSCRLELLPVPCPPPSQGNYPLDSRWAWIKNNLGNLVQLDTKWIAIVAGGCIHPTKNRWEPIFYTPSNVTLSVNVANKHFDTLDGLFANKIVFFEHGGLFTNGNDSVVYGDEDDLDAAYSMCGIVPTPTELVSADLVMEKMPNIDLAGYPKICPNCSKPAYFTFSNHIDCSAKCKAQGQSIFKF